MQRTILTITIVAVILSLSAGGCGAQTAEPRAVDIQPRDGATDDQTGTRWAVVIGVNLYLDRSISNLRYAVADAELIARTLVEKCGYPKENVLVMTDTQSDTLQPLRLNMLAEIPRLLQKVGENDTVFFFFSGHGFPDKEKQSYLAPRDCQRTNLALSGIRADEVANWLNRFRVPASAGLEEREPSHAVVREAVKQDKVFPRGSRGQALVVLHKFGIFAPKVQQHVSPGQSEAPPWVACVNYAGKPCKGATKGLSSPGCFALTGLACSTHP